MLENQCIKNSFLFFMNMYNIKNFKISKKIKLKIIIKNNLCQIYLLKLNNCCEIKSNQIFTNKNQKKKKKSKF